MSDVLLMTAFAIGCTSLFVVLPRLEKWLDDDVPLTERSTGRSEPSRTRS